MAIKSELEEWRPIKDYEGLYEVSNKGRVKALWFHNNISHLRKEHIMAQTDNGHGYLVVSLTRDGKRKNHYVHRLVADAFIENNAGLPYVNHKDYNTKNNESNNLEWCTPSYNSFYSVCNRGRRKAVIGKSGHQFITKRAYGFEVWIKLKYYGKFKTLEEAISRRDSVLHQLGYDFDLGRTLNGNI